ncbi:hypothetical protein [Larkinella soli]|uniref:hypothetical protein n=1 Tax=Larkinella soli TaxID=1770527 RepID=UPI000FFB4A30|nr:hypothetical protein [Larkinella soli]
MFDGIRLEQLVVDERHLIRHLGIKIPLEEETGEIRYDLPTYIKWHNGLRVQGRPRPPGSAKGRYCFQLRGSLIKAANQGEHNRYGKNPSEILAVLDELATGWGIDPFRTPINNLELSMTWPVAGAEVLPERFLLYLNRKPVVDSKRVDGVDMPYVKVKCGQHVLKLYVPVAGHLRFELKAHTMQFLGQARPKVLADLARPQFAPCLAQKVTVAFEKILWTLPVLDAHQLPVEESRLYQEGRVAQYWLVDRKQFDCEADFKRVERQRHREKLRFRALVDRYWTGEPLAELKKQLEANLADYMAQMHSKPYQQQLTDCWDRWKILFP